MRKQWLARVYAVFFAVVFAGGGGALPVADAVFHRGDRTGEAVRLVNPAAAVAHDAACTLGVPAPVAAASAPATGGERLASPLACAAMPVQEIFLPHSVPLLRHSRAPPASPN